MKTKNLPLIIGISLPIVFVIIISCVLFLPSLFARPSYNFLYTIESFKEGIYSYNYVIEGNHLVKNGEAPTLYLYNVKTDSATEVSLEEVQNLLIDSSEISPDGYSISYKRDGGDGLLGFIFSDNKREDSFLISKGTMKKKLNITQIKYSSGFVYEKSFRFIGWIK